MYNISDIKSYNNSMAKSIDEKLFFLDKVEYCGLLVDFGCADGSLLVEAKKRRNDISVLGYDINKDMCREANNNGIETVNSYSKLKKYVKSLKKPTTLLMSSVLHEIKKPEDSVLDSLHSGLYKRIAIRDMHHIDSGSIGPRFTIEDMFRYYIEHNTDDTFFNRLNDFEDRYGGVSSIHNLMHFFLKYKYKEDWQRELNEDYFSFDSRKVIYSGCRVDYMQCYMPDFIYNDIVQKFNMHFYEPTHIKLILTH